MVLAFLPSLRSRLKPCAPGRTMFSSADLAHDRNASQRAGGVGGG
jgi:hypothetical protein